MIHPSYNLCFMYIYKKYTLKQNYNYFVVNPYDNVNPSFHSQQEYNSTVDIIVILIILLSINFYIKGNHVMKNPSHK